jgi:hypothetical protein
MIRHPHKHPYDNHLDYLSSEREDDRKLAARMTILVLLAAADPERDKVITDEMGEIATIPRAVRAYPVKELDLEFGGSEWIGWAEDNWDDQNEPAPEVLHTLEDAILVAQHGSSDNTPRAHLPHPQGDGRPCDKPGANPYDEAERAIRDLQRFVEHFVYSVNSYTELSAPYQSSDLQDELDTIKSINREWWSKWSTVVTRARYSIEQINDSQLEPAKHQAFEVLGIIAEAYQEPLGYYGDEQPGDHLFRSLHRAGAHEQRQRLLNRLGDAYDKLTPLRRGCGLYIQSPPSSDPKTVEDPRTRTFEIAETEIVVQTKGKGRRRSKDEIRHDNLKAALFIEKNPKATRKMIADHLGLSTGMVSQIPAWERLRAVRAETRGANRATGYKNIDEL